MPPEIETPRPSIFLWGPWATAGFASVIFMSSVSAEALVLASFVLLRMASGSPVSITQVAGLTADGVVLPLSTLTSTIVGLGLIVVFIKLRRGASVPQYLDLRPITRKTTLAVLAITAGLIILTEGVSALLGKSSTPDFMIEAYRTSQWPVLLGIAIVILAPAFEETFFCGFLFVGLQPSRIGLFGTIGLTALMWSLLHIQYEIYVIATIFGSGIVLGIVRHKTRSLWSPLLAHAFWNLVAMVEIALQVNGLIRFYSKA